MDGYGWPIQGIFDLGWHKATKFRLDPGFYNVDVNVLINLETWRKLDDPQRKFLTDAGLWLESLDKENEAINKAEIERQSKAGILPLKFGDAEAKRFVERAYEVGWQSVGTRNASVAKQWRPLIGD